MARRGGFDLPPLASITLVDSDDTSNARTLVLGRGIRGLGHATEHEIADLLLLFQEVGRAVRD